MAPCRGARATHSTQAPPTHRNPTNPQTSAHLSARGLQRQRRAQYQPGPTAQVDGHANRRSPVGARHSGPMGRAFSPSERTQSGHLGRWPRLVWFRAVGPRTTEGRTISHFSARLHRTCAPPPNLCVPNGDREDRLGLSSAMPRGPRLPTPASRRPEGMREPSNPDRGSQRWRDGFNPPHRFRTATWSERL
jgi:hypothetical protein